MAENINSDPSAGASLNHHLIGFYTRYSTWTARVEILLGYYPIEYRKSYFNLYTPSGRESISKYSSKIMVPVLITKPPGANTDIAINDSLSICEYLAETHPHLPLWPKDPLLRALARSAVAEMHSGFPEVRNTYDGNFLGRYTGNVPITAKGRKEVERILEVWKDARVKTAERYQELDLVDEGFLFGEFGIADAFFWPVLWRFRSYSLPLDTASPEALAWMKKMWNDPVVKAQASDYYCQAEDPETHCAVYEDIFKGRQDVTYGKFEEDWEFSV